MWVTRVDGARAWALAGGVSCAFVLVACGPGAGSGQSAGGHAGSPDETPGPLACFGSHAEEVAVDPSDPRAVETGGEALAAGEAAEAKTGGEARAAAERGASR